MSSKEISELEQQLKSQKRKCKNFSVKPKDLPYWVRQAILNLTADVPSRQLYNDALRMAENIETRKAVVKRRKEEEEGEMNIDQSKLSRTALFAETNENARIRKTEKLFKSRDFYVYNDYSSLAYMISMALRKFTAMSKIFEEIRLKDPNFKPHKLLDVNSGVGSTVWAAHCSWPGSLTEAVHCEDSEYQSKTCKSVHQSNSRIEQFPTIFYRRRVVPKGSFDLVVSGHALLDLIKRKETKDYFERLTEALSDGGYLIFLESSYIDSFKALLGARSHLLRKGFEIFSPCPHSAPCPAFGNHGRPCAFTCDFQVPVLDQISNEKEEEKRFAYSYIVARRSGSDRKALPRLVLGAKESVSDQHVNRFACMPDAQLWHIQASRKDHPNFYKLLSRTHNQDELPVGPESIQEENDCGDHVDDAVSQ